MVVAERVPVPGNRATGYFDAASASPARLLGIGVFMVLCGIGLVIYEERFIAIFEFVAVKRQRRRPGIARLSRFVSSWVAPTVFIVAGAILIVLGVSRAT